MACSCIKGGRYDFRLEVIGKEKLIYTDLSEWMTEAPYVILDSQKITVSKNGSDGNKMLSVKPTGMTVLELEEVLQSVCHDGFYAFSTFGCFNCSTGEWGERQYTKHKAITPNTQCKIDYLLSTEDEKEFDKLKEIQCLLDAVHANTELGKLKQAASLLEIVKKKLKKYDCKICDC